MPLALLALMITAWVGARAFTWDSPTVNSASALAASEDFPATSYAALTPVSGAGPSLPAPQSTAYSHPYASGYYPASSGYGGGYPYPAGPAPHGYAPQGYVAYGHPPHMPVQGQPGRGHALQQIVYYPVYAGIPHAHGPYPPGGSTALARGPTQSGRGGFARAPELAPLGSGYLPHSYSLGDISRFAGQDVRRTGQASRPGSGAGQPPTSPPHTDRWMLDMFGFYRQGSSALSIPQGRSPIYGASQLSANLQWRAKPSWSHDPRIFLRAYQAQVEGGESEIAAGVSARPFGKVPLRMFGELRATQSPANTDLGVGVETKFRPAAYAATEFAPVKLPMGFALETYGAAGYVAGSPSTYFLDGQAVATRELLRIGKPGAGGGVSVGGGVWGGAQRDAKRLDVGPTLRFDVDIGKLPARVSVDYREQVAGDAEPDSGVAATVSTRF